MGPAVPLSISINPSPPSSPPQSPDLSLPPVGGITFPSPGQGRGSAGRRLDALRSADSDANRTPSSHATTSGGRGDTKQGVMLPDPASKRGSINKLDSPGPAVATTPRFHRRRLVTADDGDDDAITPTTASAPKTSWFSSIFARRPSLDTVGKIAKGGSGGGVYSSHSLSEVNAEVTKVLASIDAPYKNKKANQYDVEYVATRSPKAPNTVSTSLRKSIFRRNTAPSPAHIKKMVATDKPGNKSAAPDDDAEEEEPTSSGSSSGGSPGELPGTPPVSQRTLSEPTGETKSEKPLSSSDLPGGVMSDDGSEGKVTASGSGSSGNYRSRTQSDGTERPPVTTPQQQQQQQQAASPPPYLVLTSPLKFTIEILQDKSKDLRCVKFSHRSGDLASFQRLQKDITQRLKL